MARCTRFHNAGAHHGTGTGPQNANVDSTRGLVWGQIRHHSEWECTQCRKCNFMDRSTCRLCGKQRQKEDTVVAGDTEEPLPGTQPAPKRAPFNSSRAAGGGGSADHAALKKAEAAVEGKNANRKNQLVQGWTQPPQQQNVPRQPWEKARAKYQEAEAGVGAAADVLVNTLETERALWEQARTECTKEDSETENRMTAAELHEVLRNVLDSVEKVCRPEARPQLGFKKQCP